MRVKFRKPAAVFKWKVSGGRRMTGISEEIDRGKKENVNLWLEKNKIVAEIY